MSRVTAYESSKLNFTYPTQLVCHLADVAAERKFAITEAIRDSLSAARTLGGAPLMTHERLAYLAHRKKLPLHAVVGDALERAAEGLPDAPESVRTGIHEYSPEEVEAIIETLRVSSGQVRSSGVRFAPQVPLQEVAHLERYARLQKCALPEATRDRLEFWRTLGGASLKAHQRIHQYASAKNISLESAVANLLTDYARQLPDPPPELQLENGLQVLPLEGILERLGDALVATKAKQVKARVASRSKRSG